ncbi:MAG: cupin domain-containing protein [Acidobacteriaceae bacterium]|nr:cupin domain-containing protein [Acidobacteriaceae bacterium]
MNRPVFVNAAAACGIDLSVPLPLWTEEQDPSKTAKIPSGQDRLNEQHNIGVSDATFKVLTKETGGNLFVVEQSNYKKGGPPRHLHCNDEEYFYVIEGNYIVEVGLDRFELGSGDSLLAPRKILHAWAFVGDDKGRLVISFAPANKMEAYFRLVNRIRAAHTYTDPQ